MNIKNLIFRHFKGNKYEIICYAKHSETNEDLIVYKQIEDDKIWVRSKDNFFERINVNDKIVLRFEPL